MEPRLKHPLRGAPRYAVRLLAKYRPAGSADWWEGHTENISRSGVLFRTEHLMPSHTPVDVLMSLPNGVGGAGSGTITCRGRVVRTEPRQPDHLRASVAVTIASYRFAHSSSSEAKVRP
jgi:hypothetical protein